MAVDVESVFKFLRRNGLTEAESALRDDINEKNQLASFDFEKFVFPIPPPIRITSSTPPSDSPAEDLGRDGSKSKSSSSDEFVSLDSFTSGFCSSSDFCINGGFVNPYGDGSSSDGQSQFGTARTYPERSEYYLHNETDDEDEYFMSPAFRESDFFICPATAQDKFITDNQFEFGLYDKSSPQRSQTEASLDYLDKSFLLDNVEDDSKDHIGLDDKTELDRFSCEDDTKDEEVDVVHEFEDEYEVFELRIIQWKNRTGFEE